MMNKAKNEEMEIDLLELLRVLLRKWYLLLLGLVIGAVLAGGYTWMQAPVYESTVQFYILPQSGNDTISTSDTQVGTALSSDFVEIAQSRTVIDAAIDEVEREEGVTLTREEVQGMAEISVKPDTRILDIVVHSEDAEVACSLANALGDTVGEQIGRIMQTDPLTPFETAEVAQEPIDNNLTRNIAVGALAGLIILALFVIIPHLANDRIQTAEDVEKYLETGVLGMIPEQKGNYRGKKKFRRR